MTCAATAAHVPYSYSSSLMIQTFGGLRRTCFATSAEARVSRSRPSPSATAHASTVCRVGSSSAAASNPVGGAKGRARSRGEQEGAQATGDDRDVISENARHLISCLFAGRARRRETFEESSFVHTQHG